MRGVDVDWVVVIVAATIVEIPLSVIAEVKVDIVDGMGRGAEAVSIS